MSAGDLLRSDDPIYFHIQNDPIWSRYAWRSFTTELEPILRKSAEKHKARALPAQRKKRGGGFVLIFGATIYLIDQIWQHRADRKRQELVLVALDCAHRHDMR